MDSPEDNIRKDIRNYEKLSKIKNSDEFKDFFELQLNTVTQKMLLAFTSDHIKSWEDFVKVKGEVTAYLYPIQEVYSADAAKKQLLASLKEYYAKDA